MDRKQINDHLLSFSGAFLHISQKMLFYENLWHNIIITDTTAD